MRFWALIILFVLTSRVAEAQQCNTGCTYTVTGNNGTQNNLNLNGNQTICITGNATLGNMNVNGNNNSICIKTGVTASYSNNLANSMTINVYGTFTFSGNINSPSNFTFNVYSGGVLNISTGLSNIIVNNNSGGTVNFTSSSSSSSLTISNSGTFNYAGTSLSTSTVTNYGTFTTTGSGTLTGVNFTNKSSGVFKFGGNEVNNNTVITNDGQVTFTNTGQVTLQGSTNITNNTGSTFTATAPSKVMVNQGSFTNSGTSTFTNLENQEGNFTNNSGATLTFQQGTFQHGGLHNYGAMIVNCTGSFSSDCNNPCVRMGNKNAGQFSNDGTFTIHGSLCVGSGVIFHNNGTTTVDNNMNLENSNSQWVQGTGGTTTVGGTTTNPGGTFSGGTICSGSINGSVNSTVSCGGTPPTINDLTASTCKNTAVSINVPATAASGTSITWSSLKIINGTDTVSATAGNPTLTTSKGTYKISYTSTSASVLYTPTTGNTASNVIYYKIAALSGSTQSYANPKMITTSIAPAPNKPSLLISNIP